MYSVPGMRVSGVPGDPWLGCSGYRCTQCLACGYQEFQVTPGRGAQGIDVPSAWDVGIGSSR